MFFRFDQDEILDLTSGGLDDSSVTSPSTPIKNNDGVLHL